MAGNTWEKRQREKAKRERKEAKRARRDEKREAQGETPEQEGPTNEELMEQFADLNRAHAEGNVDEATFLLRRNAIWTAMGLPVD